MGLLFKEPDDKHDMRILKWSFFVDNVSSDSYILNRDQNCGDFLDFLHVSITKLEIQKAVASSFCPQDGNFNAYLRHSIIRLLKILMICHLQSLLLESGLSDLSQLIDADSCWVLKLHSR